METSRRTFLKLLGLTSAVSPLARPVVRQFIDRDAIDDDATKIKDVEDIRSAEYAKIPTFTDLDFDPLLVRDDKVRVAITEIGLTAQVQPMDVSDTFSETMFSHASMPFGSIELTGHVADKHLVKFSDGKQHDYSIRGRGYQYSFAAFVESFSVVGFLQEQFYWGVTFDLKLVGDLTVS